MMEDRLELIARAASHTERIALIEARGERTYRDLLAASESVASRLLDGAADLAEARVAFLVEPGFDYVAVQWGIWRAGGVAVPLAVSHPVPELEYTISDAEVSILVAGSNFLDRLQPIAATRSLRLESVPALRGPFGATSPLPTVEENRRAMILYTSGTTSRPKGVVSTHANIRAQVEALVDAWDWSADDHILLVLPLHHVHGIVNVLTCALWSGARCTVHPRFEADAVWRELARGSLTLFMAVPTVYSRLIAAWEQADDLERRRMSEGCRRLRLMVSGSAALPVSVLERWREISGHTLLERYGMTEIGMALSNPLKGERRPGHVGIPLPRVHVRLVDEDGREVERGAAGEIEVRGPAVFHEYWRRPDATAESFRDGWFRTGDTAEVNDGYYRILGRNSVDILKTGGYKVSALEIEEVLRSHPAIAECAVVGMPSEEWGEVVCAAIVPARPIEEQSLARWTAERLAPYKLPRRWLIVDDLPRNAMGKVTKPAIKELFG